MTKHTIDTLPPNDGKAALEVAKNLAKEGRFTDGVHRSILNMLIFDDEWDAYVGGLDALGLTPTREALQPTD